MASSEEKQHLESLLADTFGSALDSVRRSLAGEIHRHAEGRERVARVEAHRTVRDALSRLDACRRQSELLGALLEECGRFASRTALWITSGDGARGWASFGFDGGPDIESLHADYALEPWDQVARGSGYVELEGDAAVELAATMGPGRPERAVLVPLVLRDRVAAVVYADDLGADDSLSLEAVQVLTLTASLLMEVQGLRGRERTPTLHPVSVGPSLDLWEEGTMEAAPPSQPQIESREPVAPPEAVSEPLPTPEIEAAPEPETAPAYGDEATWAEAEELPEAEVESVPDTETASYETGVEAAELEEFEVEELAEPEEIETARASDEITAPIPSEPAGADPTVRISQEMIEEAQAEVLAPEEADEEVLEEVEVETETAEEEDGSEDRTVLLDRSTIPDVEAPPPRPKPAPPAAGTSTEVAPPPDLEGPGLAFRQEEETEAEEAASEEDAAAHEEARRLARLLVSEIKLYNEEEVEAGRRSNDIYKRLQEDIDRSRQMYRDRVDPGVRDDVDYFQQELVNILAGGDPDALGI